MARHYDINAFVSEDKERGSDDKRRWYVVNPDKAYPQTIAHIRQLLDEDAPALSPELTTYLNVARAIPAEAWDYAVVPRGDFHGGEAALQDREQALEVARLWFTQELHEAIDRAPMGVQIARSDDWKL